MSRADTQRQGQTQHTLSALLVCPLGGISRPHEACMSPLVHLRCAKSLHRHWQPACGQLSLLTLAALQTDMPTFTMIFSSVTAAWSLPLQPAARKMYVRDRERKSPRKSSEREWLGCPALPINARSELHLQWCSTDLRMNVRFCFGAAGPAGCTGLWLRTCTNDDPSAPIFSARSTVPCLFCPCLVQHAHTRGGRVYGYE